ncbi:MAG: PhnD/SsuA/transferrin family substrate-binding protein [Phycisphaerales bacterium]|nr:MAG: PhnD/SsuA/transferrin family substrate-binding protein [Phycisphaerales bacterium]
MPTRTCSGRAGGGTIPGVAVHILVSLVLTLATAYPALGEDREDPIKIGVCVKRGPGRCLEKWGPTAEYLTSAISETSFTIVPLRSGEIEPAVEHGDVDFILSCPSCYVGLEHFYGASRIATLKNLHLNDVYTVLGGVVFRRADRNDINRLTDLEGKTFMAPDEKALAAWYAVWREMKDHGLDPHRDLAELRFSGGSMDDVVYAVRDGEVDAGSVRTDLLERMALEGVIELDDFHVLHDHSLHHDRLGDDHGHLPFAHSTRAYPEWPLAKAKHTSDNLSEQVAVALLSMSPDSRAARAARCAGWTVPLNYQPVHDCLRELRMGPYKDYGKITPGDVLSRYWPWITADATLLALMAAVIVWAVRLNRKLSRTQSAMREGWSYVQTILDTVQTGIIVIDAETHTIVDANPAAVAMIGDPKEEVVGRECHGYICTAEVGRCPITDLGQQLDNSEHVLVNVNGEIIPVLKTVTALTLSGRKCLLDSFVDITDRKQAEEELAKHRDHLEELVEQRTKELESSREQLRHSERLASLGTLTAGIAHEINNPVGMIRLSAENALGLRDKPNGADLVDRALNKILGHAERCGQITRSMLQFARQEPTEKWPSTLNTAVGRAVEQVRADAVGRGIEFEVVLSSDLPDVLMNPIQVEQAFVNLIQNAVESSGPGTRITVLTESTPDAVRGTVSDHGRGMTAEEQARVFDPFFTTRFREGGTGLGLSIVHGIIAEHGGTIRVNSESGRGTTITVELPSSSRREGGRLHVQDTGR